ncbi:MAG: winged helix-turn-helix domain-containing protein [Acidobacteria bacterium]|nr:winged helix-turn-helix domain-containing protein [Acidobacteriota bacterium]
MSPSRRRLMKDDAEVRLTPKAFDILLVLSRCAGDLVEKQVLMKEVWGDVFVDESTLTQNIFTLRKALGDPSYIETIPRVGYRLTVPVTPVAQPIPEPAPPTRRSLLFVGGAFGVLLVIGAGYLSTHNRTQQAGAMADLRSLVVLPFVNIGDAGHEHLADGITEETINALSAAQRLRVVARSTAFQFKGKPQDVRELGKKLNVEAVLEGSVSRQQNQLRVTAQLSRAADGTIIWSKSWMRDWKDVFAVQREIAQTIAGNLGPSAGKPGTGNVEAYNLYLLGRFHRSKFVPASIEKAVASYRQAIEKDPSYAAPYAALADCYQVQGYSRSLPPKEAFPLAASMVRKALALDPSQVYAHTVDAKIKLYFDRDWAAAEQAISRALSIDPSDSELHHTYSHLLIAMGRFTESLAESHRAIELDPLNQDVLGHLPFHYYLSRDYDAGISAALRSLEVDPQHVPTLAHLLWNYRASGRMEQAVETGAKLGYSPALVALLRDSLAPSAKDGYWRTFLKHQLKTFGPSDPNGHAFEFGALYSRLNDRDHAFEWLNRAYEDRSSWLVYLKVDPAFDNLRADPRFTDLVRRIGLP